MRVLPLLCLLACGGTTIPTRGSRDAQRPRDTGASDSGAPGDSGDSGGRDSGDDSGDTGGADPAGELAVHVLDVGQGDGVLVVSPDGVTMMVDAGDDEQYGAVRAALRRLGVDRLDYVLASHLHADHMGGLDLVLADHPEVVAVYDAGGTYDSSDVDDFFREAGDRRTTVATGDLLDLGPSMTAEVLHASEGDVENENNNSVVLRLTYGDVRVLLGGDCEFPVCERGFDPGPVDVYKVHHHGAADGSSRPLLAAMQPAAALISVGADNDYGHPSEEALGRLDAVGARVWRTDQDGDLAVRIDGATWTVNGDGP